MSESIVITGCARTPMGAFQGDFASLAAHDLGGVAIRAAVERALYPELRKDLAVARRPGVVHDAPDADGREHGIIEGRGARVVAGRTG